MGAACVEATSFTLSSRFERRVTKLPGLRQHLKGCAGQVHAYSFFLSDWSAVARGSTVGAWVLGLAHAVASTPSGRLARKGAVTCTRWWRIPGLARVQGGR